MNRKLMTLLVSGMLVAGSATVAGAHHRDGHEANYFGLCTAWSHNGGNGEGNGQGGQNGNAFAELADTDNDGDVDGDDEDLEDFCARVLANPPGGGEGNPGGGSQNGNGNGRNR